MNTQSQEQLKTPSLGEGRGRLPSSFFSMSDSKPMEVTWQEIYTRITSTTNDVFRKTRQSIEARQRGETKRAYRLKSSMGFFTPAVQMKDGRDATKITAFTCHGICDFDHISRNHINLLVQRVAQDPHTRLVYITNSQEGIRIIFSWKTDKDEDFFVWDKDKESHEAFMARCLPYHQKAWTQGNLYYQQLLDGAEIDVHCKDPNRISFYSHDLHAFYNANPEPMIITNDETMYLPDAEDTVDTTETCPVTEEGGEDSSVVDESIITRLLDKISYTRSHRHGWWIKLGARLKYFSKSTSQFSDYKSAAIRIITERGLLLNDDPTVRNDKEVDDCLAWGYEHGEVGNSESRKLGNSESRNVGNSDSSDDEEDVDELIAKGCPVFPDEVYENLPQCLLDGLAPVLDYVVSTVEGQGANVEGQKSKVGGQVSDVEGQKSNVEGQCQSQSQSQKAIITFKPDIPRRRADALLMSLLTNYSVLCSNVHLLYGDRDYSPNIGFLCLSPAGNGKSVIEYGFRILESTDRYLERISNEEHKAWEEQVEAYEMWKAENSKTRVAGYSKSRNLGNSENIRSNPLQSVVEKHPSAEISNFRTSEFPTLRDSEFPPRPGDEPQAQMLAMPGTTSRSQFTICMNAMGKGGLIMNSTEINTLISTLKLDVGNFVDLLCKAMMNEQITQFFKVDNKPIKIKHPRLSVCMSGTFDQFHNFIPSIEDGLFSRFFIQMMEQHTVWISQKPDPERRDYSDVYKRLSDEALQMWLMLQDNPTWTLFTDEQWDRHTSHYTSLINNIIHEGYQDRVAILNRHGLGQMRIASVLTAIRKYEQYRVTCDDFQSKYRTMVCRDDDFRTAEMISECLLPHALQLSTTMLKLHQKNVQPMSAWNWVDDALSSLPDKFTIKEWLSVGERYGRSKSQAYRSINNLVAHGAMRQKCEFNIKTYYKSAR